MKRNGYVFASTPAAESGIDIRSFGLFLGLNPEDAVKMNGYDAVVIDAQYFTADEIKALRESGKTVYSYLNIGSVEKFRSYYPSCARYTLGRYEDWPDERWCDMANPLWRAFLCETLAKELADKAIDGFFLDNLDVYYEYPTESVYRGLRDTLACLEGYGLPMTANGGDIFLREAAERGDLATLGLTAVHQECVFTAIDFDADTFGRQTKEETAYCQEYLAFCRENGLNCYITEYAETFPSDLYADILEYGAQYGCPFYLAGSLALDGTPGRLPSGTAALTVPLVTQNSQR